MPSSLSIPLPGLENEPEVILGSDAGKKQEFRTDQTAELASILAGGPIEILETEAGPVLVNTETGETLEDRAAAFGVLLHLASAENNQAAGYFEAPGGRNWYGAAALWKSSLRVDPNWMETMRRRSRNNARLALRRMFDTLPQREKLARHFGWKQRLSLKLVTLTMPHIKGASSVAEVRRINRAFALLTKREFWKRMAWGGVKGIEDALDADGPHVHIHALLLARWVDREALRAEWGACVTLATEEATGEPLEAPLQAFIDVRQVTRKGKATGDAVDVEDAVNEVTKYVTKPSTFLEADKAGRMIPREVLVDLCEVERWPRMFELLGRARELVKRRKSTHADKLETAAAASAALDSIHRAYLTGEPFKLGPDLSQVVADAGAFDTEDDAECTRRMIEALRNLQKVPPKKTRPPSWRVLLDSMPFDLWLQTMIERAKRGRKFRLRQLIERFPGARIVLFDGEVIDCPA